MRIELATGQPDGSGPHWVDVRETIKGGDIFAVHEANVVPIGENGRPSELSFQKAEDDQLIALAQRLITGWSFQVPLPQSFAQMKSFLSDFDAADLRKFRAKIRPLLDQVVNGGESPDPKSGDAPADAVDAGPAPEAG